jgi:hypothetical protein
MKVTRTLVTLAATCAAVGAMAGSASAADRPTGNLYEPVVKSGSPLTAISSPVSFTASSIQDPTTAEEVVLTTFNPDQGPFNCDVEITGTVDNSSGDVTLDNIVVSNQDPLNHSVECGGGVDVFDMPWPGKVYVEDNGGGNYTAWMLLDLQDVGTPLGDYHSDIDSKTGCEGSWVKFTPANTSLPIGPLAGASIDEELIGFGSGNATEVGGFTVTPDSPLYSDKTGSALSSPLSTCPY